MSDLLMQKKSKKTKKKSESNSAPETACNETKCVAGEQRKTSLPHDLNIKTPENIEVTLVKGAREIEVNGEGSIKKKKKSKKKAKEVSKETSAENNNSNAPFLNFSENGIHLVNHPEISVTFSDASQPKVTLDENIKEEKPLVEEKQDTTATSSKKKKKKKKKGNSNLTVSSSTNEASYPTPTPTYTKVVTSDNTCVLVVNNENLSAAPKPCGNIGDMKPKVAENKIKFSLSSEKQVGDVLITKNFTSDGNANLGSSVSIFPVLTNVDAKTLEKNTIISQPNLETVSSILKKEVSSVPEKENTTEGTALTKAQLKAERRAKQEAQRAAKLTKNTVKMDSDSNATAQNKMPKPPKEKISPKKSGAPTGESITEATCKSSTVVSEKDNLRKVWLFSHLPECKKVDLNAKIHPTILEVGSQYSKGIICGSNARCVALLGALREIIEDYTPPPDKKFCRELESNVQVYLNYLDNCRPLSVSMINAVKFLKHQINHTPSELEVGKARERLCRFINNFVNEEILLAKEAICNSASAKIVDGDVILVFAHSSLVKDVLLKAYNANKRFRVVVADSRPKLEGLEMLRYLVKQGLQCSYITVKAVSYVMKEVSKVIIGAHALLSNGCVMSRLGSKQIALIASSYSVPVLVCCETYKFCERVLTDSFMQNELGKPEHITAATLVSNDSLKNWHDLPSLQLLNLLYDVTPPDLISMVITEKGVLPCTSVPVVLRVRYAGLHE